MVDTRVGAALLLLHLVPTAFYLAEVRGNLGDVRSPYWILEDELAVFDHLSKQRSEAGLSEDEPSIVLLTAPSLGVLVPWLAGVRTYLGHPDHTRNHPMKRGAARTFFRIIMPRHSFRRFFSLCAVSAFFSA